MGTLGAVESPAAMRSRTPAAVKWAIALSAIMAIANLAFAYVCYQISQDPGAIVARLTPEIDAYGPDAALLRDSVKSSLQMTIPIGVIFACLNTALCFAKPKPAIWIAHSLNIAMAILSIFPAPIAIPLGIKWLSKEVKDYYNFR